MTQKTVGYTELEWTCQRCGTRNPGLQKTCTNCGAPMSAEDQFEMPDQQELITDEAKLAAAAKGPDIHCPYCGARNPAGTEACVQCGGDLKEGASRQAGRVLGPRQVAPAAEIECPFCNSKIRAGSLRCPNCGGDLGARPAAPQAAAPARQKLPTWMVILAALALLVCIGSVAAFAILSSRTNDVRAQVQQVNWVRTIDILELRPVRQDDWEDRLPAEAQEISCSDQYRFTSPNPAPKSTEVCGTPYTIDEGSGVGKVVQDCEYRVYDSYCEYTVQDWQVVSQASAQGGDLQPLWPALDLQSGQQEGSRSERYQVIFTADGQDYEYTLSDPEVFAQFAPGSEWTLKVNTFGAITEVLP